ncbi:MAG: hypothetical protein IT447_01790 [Phycisphaerales bacterium]|jgi:endonuclease III|nr:hypothetical protein [Phycisphaerales bacterium]
MKNATKHAEGLKSLLKKMLKEHKPQPKEAMEPLKALVRGAMSFDVSDAKADEAMKLIDREFVDLNELRVATDLEIAELLGTKYPAIERRVAMITLSLNHIFEKEHTLSLERLKNVSKRDARQFLRGLPDIHPFVEGYVMLYGFDAPAIPMDDELLEFMREHEIVDEQITLDEAQRFVEHHLKDKECYEFHILSRRSSRGESKPKKKSKA